MDSNTFFEFILPENPLPARLQKHRMRNEFTDMTIKVGEEQFRAHRLVLADTSPVIKALLSEKWFPDGLCEFSEEFVDSNIVEDLLDYFYCGRIILTTDNAHSICTAAHFLDVPELLAASEKFLSKNVDSSNVLDLFFFSEKLQLEILRGSCVEHLFSKSQNVFNDSKILNFSAEQLKLILKEMDDKTQQATDFKLKESTFEAVAKWVEHNPTERLPFLPSLLKAIPLNNLSFEFLRKVVVTQSIVSNSLTCSKLVMDALSDTPKSRRKMSTVPNKLYCFGGSDGSYLSSVSCLDLSTGKWTYSTSMSISKAYMAGTVIGNKIYLCGGHSSQGVLNTMEVFDCSTNTWSQLQPMPQPQYDLGLTVLNNFIYVVGGSYPSVGTADVFRYCVKNNEWKTMKSLKAKRQAHQLVQLGGFLHAIGGINNKTVEQYNPDTDQWVKISDILYEHSYSGGTLHNDKIYVHSSQGFQEYTPETNAWRTLNPAHDSSGSCLVSVKDKLWLFGGNKTKKSVYEFDTRTEQWTQLADMDIGRYYFAAFAVSC